VSAGLSAGPPHGGVRAVRVQAVFHVSDERCAHTVSSLMIDRAHEIANLPECECDVDVRVERSGVGATGIDGTRSAKD
jgi:hypothetical protein